jgi:uroporphyrinogen-III synthase
VFLPRSDRADDRLPSALRAAGAEVREVVAYRTTIPESIDPKILESIRKAEVDVVVFASPSAFENFRAVIAPAVAQELSKQVRFAAIGPTTSAAVREAGARVAIEANESSAAMLAEAIAEFYEKSQTTTRRP